MPKKTFWATKKIRKPTIVRFKKWDGSVVKFRATKIIRKPVKISFYTRRKSRYY